MRGNELVQFPTLRSSFQIQETPGLLALFNRAIGTITLEEHFIKESFPNSVGKPMCMAQLAREIIQPALLKARIQWHVGMPFRRGLATDLHQIGVSDERIRAILRHSHVAVTQTC